MECSGSQCHNPGSQKGISFSSQSTAYNAVKGRVTAGNGPGSSFYRTVTSGSVPPGGPKRIEGTSPRAAIRFAGDSRSLVTRPQVFMVQLP